MDALNNILAPVKPSLQLVTKNIPAPINNIAVNLIGAECTTSLVHNLDFSAANEACLKLGISKALGVAIISAASIVKIPQLIKLINSQSAAGLSFLSYLLETASYTVTLAYSIRNGFPFSTFGETAFIAIQDVAIATLILVYSGKSAGAAAFVAVFAAAAYALFGPGELVDIQTLGYLQAGAGLLGLAAKIPQILTVYREGSTGQLSAFAVFNYLFGSLSRIYTTLQEVDDKLILYSFIAGFFLNAVLAAQMIYYWNSSPSSTPASVKRAINKTTNSITGSGSNSYSSNTGSTSISGYSSNTGITSNSSYPSTTKAANFSDALKVDQEEVSKGSSTTAFSIDISKLPQAGDLGGPIATGLDNAVRKGPSTRRRG